MSIFGVQTKQPKNYITIVEEYKGALKKFNHFSFGNGCKKENVGYVTILPLKVIGISLSCDRLGNSGEVKVAISINGYIKNDYSLTIYDGETKNNVVFNKPLPVKAGSSLNTVSLENSKADCTIVGILLET